MERERSLGLNVEVSARFARRRRSIERRLSQRSKLKHCVFEIPNSTERCKCMVEDRSRLSTSTSLDEMLGDFACRWLRGNISSRNTLETPIP
jgi:hypothetical protein